MRRILVSPTEVLPRDRRKCGSGSGDRDGRRGMERELD